MNYSDPVLDVSKVSNRKRIGEDIEKLREKASREASKIIKLKVAQDTAYWDLKEKLQAVEANHERLQANMVDVQMQHEAISTSYQAELRRRPETLNKLAASRAIADTLEENTARLRDTLRRQGADCAALQRAYAGAAQRAVLAVAGAQGAVRAHRAALSGVGERERAAADRARDEATRAAAAAAAHCQQAESARRDASAAAAEAKLLRETLQGTQRDLDQTVLRSGMLAEEIDRLKRREGDAIQLLREAETEMERLTGELRAAREEHARREAELEVVRGEFERLRVESNLELDAAKAQIENLKATYVAERSHCDAELKVERAEMERFQAESKAELEALRVQIGYLEAALVAERTRRDAELKEASVEQEQRDAELERERSERAALEGELRAEGTRLEAEANAARDLFSRLEAELTATRANSSRLEASLAEQEERAATDLAARADTISALMRDVTREAEARHRAQDSLRKQEIDLEDQTNIIRDLRAEKEQLQQKIQDMQGTIDNIQQLARMPNLQTTNKRATQPEPAERDETNLSLNNMLFSFMDDDSGDSMGLDAGDKKRIVHRRRVPLDPIRMRAERAAGAGTGTASRLGGAGAANRIFKNKRLDNKRN